MVFTAIVRLGGGAANSLAAMIPGQGREEDLDLRDGKERPPTLIDRLSSAITVAADVDTENFGGSGFWAWAYRRLDFGRYQPWDEKIQRTDIEYYQPKPWVRLLDKFARRMDRAGETTPADLPPTVAGACCSLSLMVFVVLFAQIALGDLFSSQTSLRTWGDVQLNVDYYCDRLEWQSDGSSSAAAEANASATTSNYRLGEGITRKYRRSLIGGESAHDLHLRDTWSLPGCGFPSEYFADFPRSAKPPFLDVPVLNIAWTHRIEFYEADNKTSLSKVKWLDKNGLHFGGTSTPHTPTATPSSTGTSTGEDVAAFPEDEVVDAETPVGFGAHEKAAILFNSYPYGSSDFESPFPNMTRYVREMAVTSATHNFAESLRYAYEDLGLMRKYDTFFDHDAVAFVRLDRKQLRNVKSCQLQFGLVARYQYEALRPFLLKYSREYQKKTLMNTLATGNFTWAPGKYTNEETGTWRRKTSLDNMMVLQSGWTEAFAKTFMQSMAYGKYLVNVERRMRKGLSVDTGYRTVASAATATPTPGGGDVLNSTVVVQQLATTTTPIPYTLDSNVEIPLEFTDWMLFASYVNNFMHSVESVTCDGKSGRFFNTAFVKADAPDKVLGVLTLRTAVSLWSKRFPFYILVTGNMGSERMLVTGKGDTDFQILVTRGNQIGASRLNHAVTPPSSYPAVSSPALWVCPPNRYNDQQFCDCNCGMTDPDCLLGIYPTSYCSEGEVCSPAGRCTLPVYNPGASEVAVSEPCERMSMPGDVALHGFFGHSADFVEMNGGECQVCPHDELYSGNTNRNEQNEYVCQYRPEGDIAATEVVALDAETIKSYGTTVQVSSSASGATTTNSTTVTMPSIIDSYRIVRASLGPKAGFPVKELNDTNFTVELNAELGIHELVTAIKSEPVDQTKKTQVLHLKANGQQFRYLHFASGSMSSSMTGDYADMVMQLDDDSKPFSTTGPYRIQIDSSEILVRTGSVVKTETTDTSEESEDDLGSGGSSSARRLRQLSLVRRSGTTAVGEEEVGNGYGYGNGADGETGATGVSPRSCPARGDHVQATAGTARRRKLHDREILNAKRERLGLTSLEDEENDLRVLEESDDRVRARLLSTPDANTTDDENATNATSAAHLGLTTMTISNVKSCHLNNPKRQRLDVARYPVGLKSAGVRGILSRQYTANLPSEDVSIYRYFYPNVETTSATSSTSADEADATTVTPDSSAARNLYFTDSPSNSIPGATNCFTSFYQSPAFTKGCAVTAKTYKMYMYLQTPPKSSFNAGLGHGVLQPNPAAGGAWTLTTGVRTNSGTTNLGIGNFNPLKDAIAEALAEAFGMPVTKADASTGITHPDIAEVRIKGPTPFQSAGGPVPWNENPAKRGFNCDVQFTLRKWYNLPWLVEKAMADWDMAMMQRVKDIFNAKARLSEDIEGLYKSTDYDNQAARNAANPFEDPAEGFKLLAVTGITEVTKVKRRRQLEGRRKLQYRVAADDGEDEEDEVVETRAEGGNQGVAAPAPARPDEDSRNTKREDQEQLQIEAAPVRGLSSSSTGETLTLVYDFRAEFQMLLTLVSSGMSPHKFAASPTSILACKNALIFAAETVGIAKDSVLDTDLVLNLFSDTGTFGEQQIYDPLTGTMVMVNNNDLSAMPMGKAWAGGGGGGPGGGGSSGPGGPSSRRQLAPGPKAGSGPSPEFNIRVEVELTRHASAKAFALAAQDSTFLTLFSGELQSKHAAVHEIKDLSFTPAGQPTFEENDDQTPQKQDFTTVPEFTSAQPEKPWCDFSTATGNPGIDQFGIDYASRGGRASIFCDGLHDGLLVVNAAGFSNENLVPSNSNMRLLIRGSAADGSSTAPMEVRKIKKAYQWLFPVIDAQTGLIGDDQVTPWVCAPELWADGTCDCNCGRADWDCMGDRGIPQLFVEERLDDITSTVAVNVNCPKGDNVVVKTPETEEGELPPTCGQIKSDPVRYAYCDFATGLPTSVRENHFTTSAAYQAQHPAREVFNGTRLSAPTYMRYLWEVIELDCPLVADRPVGTMVETLGVSEVTAAAFQEKSLKTASAYVDTSLMEASVDGDFGMMGEGGGGGGVGGGHGGGGGGPGMMDPICLSANPPPFCGGGAVTDSSGATVHTTPVVKASLKVGMTLDEGTTGAMMMQDPEVVPAFQNGMATSLGVAPYNVHVNSIVVGPPSRRTRARALLDQTIISEAGETTTTTVESMESSSSSSGSREDAAVNREGSAVVSSVIHEVMHNDLGRRHELSDAADEVDEFIMGPMGELEFRQEARTRTSKRLLGSTITITAPVLFGFEVSGQESATAASTLAERLRKEAELNTGLRSNLKNAFKYVETMQIKVMQVSTSVIAEVKMPDAEAMAALDPALVNMGTSSENPYGNVGTSAPAALLTPAAGAGSGASGGSTPGTEPVLVSPAAGGGGSSSLPTGGIKPAVGSAASAAGESPGAAGSASGTSASGPAGSNPASPGPTPSAGAGGAAKPDAGGGGPAATPAAAASPSAGSSDLQFAEDMNDPAPASPDPATAFAGSWVAQVTWTFSLLKFKPPLPDVAKRTQALSSNGWFVFALRHAFLEKMRKTSSPAPAVAMRAVAVGALQVTENDQVIVTYALQAGAGPGKLPAGALATYIREEKEKELVEATLRAVNEHYGGMSNVQPKVTLGTAAMMNVNAKYSVTEIAGAGGRLRAMRGEDEGAPDHVGEVVDEEEHVRALHERVTSAYPWMHPEHANQDYRTSSGPGGGPADFSWATDALAMATALKRDVYENEDFKQLASRATRRRERRRRELQLAEQSEAETEAGRGTTSKMQDLRLPDYIGERKWRAYVTMQRQIEDAARGNDYRRELRMRLEEQARSGSVSVADVMIDSSDDVGRESSATAGRLRRLERHELTENYGHMLRGSAEADVADVEDEVIATTTDEERIRSYYRSIGNNVVLVQERLAKNSQSQEAGAASSSASDSARRRSSRRELTATTPSYNATLCPQAAYWLDEANWPPNARIESVPTCARVLLSEDQLEVLGFYDVLGSGGAGGTVAAQDLDAALSLFASATSSKQTSKKVVSFVVQSISKINLFRDKASTYLPKDRSRSTTTETYDSPESLDAHIAMFVYPKRTDLGPVGGVNAAASSSNPFPGSALCPYKRIKGEAVTNGFANAPGQGMWKHFWGKWQIHPVDNFAVKNKTWTELLEDEALLSGGAGEDAAGATGETADGAGSASSPTVVAPATSTHPSTSPCVVVPFSAAKQQRCKSAEQLLQDSKDKYRLFCSKDFLPANDFLFSIEGPLTGQWLFPRPREDLSAAATSPEWNPVDLEVTFSLTFDQKFLDVEKAYMQEGGDYVDGYPLLWAAEPLARGKAICTNRIKGCAHGSGIPANPPMLLPGIVISVNRKRTRELVKKVEPKHWPFPEEGGDSKSRFDRLLDQLDGLSLNLHAGLRTLSSAEDGLIPIKPMTAVLIQVTWQVNAIYEVDKWVPDVVLSRWATSISQLDISYQQTVDYTMRSSCSVRLLFRIDPSSQRFQEVPVLELKDFLAFVGAYAGYIGMVAFLLGLWQKLTKPFGVVDSYYVDSEYENVVGRWYVRQMKMLGFPVPDEEAEVEAGIGGVKHEKALLEEEKALIEAANKGGAVGGAGGGGPTTRIVPQPYPLVEGEHVPELWEEREPGSEAAPRSLKITVGRGTSQPQPQQVGGKVDEAGVIEEKETETTKEGYTLDFGSGQEGEQVGPKQLKDEAVDNSENSLNEEEAARVKEAEERQQHVAARLQRQGTAKMASMAADADGHVEIARPTRRPSSAAVRPTTQTEAGRADPSTTASAGGDGARATTTPLAVESEVAVASAGAARTTAEGDLDPSSAPADAPSAVEREAAGAANML